LLIREALRLAERIEMPVAPEKSPLVVRAKKDFERDMTLADEAKERNDVIELHAIVGRLLVDRKQLAEAFDGMVMGWAMLRDGQTQPKPTTADKDVIAAIERVAHEAIAFAREVVQALKPSSK
jgi:hypothetical protein